MVDLYFDENGIDPFGREVDGVLSLEQSIRRLIRTRPQSNAVTALYQEEYGVLLEDYLKKTVTRADILLMESAVLRAVNSDERVLSASVNTLRISQGTYTVLIDVTCAEGAFRLPYTVELWKEPSVPTVKNVNTKKVLVTSSATEHLARNIRRVGLEVYNEHPKYPVFYAFGRAPVPSTSLFIPAGSTKTFPSGACPTSALFLSTDASVVGAYVRIEEMVG